ncbi:MAG TPA: hypothetical protein VG148_12720 [Pyrinomonadaceae bacterium]|nr:hypothetical protein [Pyrinomonadaceae bacterium]
MYRSNHGGPTDASLPVIASEISGKKVPLALILVLLSGIGPVIAWRRADEFRRNYADLLKGVGFSSALSSARG